WPTRSSSTSAWPERKSVAAGPVTVRPRCPSPVSAAYTPIAGNSSFLGLDERLFPVKAPSRPVLDDGRVARSCVVHVRRQHAAFVDGNAVPEVLETALAREKNEALNYTRHHLPTLPIQTRRDLVMQLAFVARGGLGKPRQIGDRDASFEHLRLLADALGVNFWP